MIEHRIIINRIRLIERDDRGIKKRGEKRRISCREFSLLLAVRGASRNLSKGLAGGKARK